MAFSVCCGSEDHSFAFSGYLRRFLLSVEYLLCSFLTAGAEQLIPCPELEDLGQTTPFLLIWLAFWTAYHWQCPSHECPLYTTTTEVGENISRTWCLLHGGKANNINAISDIGWSIITCSCLEPHGRALIFNTEAKSGFSVKQWAYMAEMWFLGSSPRVLSTLHRRGISLDDTASRICLSRKEQAESVTLQDGPLCSETDSEGHRDTQARSREALNHY